MKSIEELEQIVCSVVVYETDRILYSNPKELVYITVKPTARSTLYPNEPVASLMQEDNVKIRYDGDLIYCRGE